MPVKFLNFLKSRLIFNIFCCFWMYVNKLFTYPNAHISKSKRCFNVKSSTYYLHMKTKILADFQISISVSLRKPFFTDISGRLLLFIIYIYTFRLHLYQSIVFEIELFPRKKSFSLRNQTGSTRKWPIVVKVTYSG